MSPMQKRTQFQLFLALAAILTFLVGFVAINIDRRVHKQPSTDALAPQPKHDVGFRTESGPIRDVVEAAPEDRKLVKAATTKQTVQASVTTATNHATGGGVATVEVLPAAEQPEAATGVPTVVAERLAFKDFRLDFQAVGSKVTYTLDQQFVIIQTIDRAKDGSRTAKAEVFEVTPEGRTPLEHVATQVVERDDTAPRWLTGFNVQGGLEAGATGQTSGLVGLQWLKHGRANNPGDLRFAVLTPAVTFGGTVDVGVLPISFNVANYVKHQPFTNVWVSPYLGATGLLKTSAGNPTGIGSAIGVAITATF